MIGPGTKVWRPDPSSGSGINVLHEPVPVPIHPVIQEFERLRAAMHERFSERTSEYASIVDPLAIMKRASRMLDEDVFRHGIEMVAQKIARVLQEYHTPGTVPVAKFEDACVDAAVYLLLTAVAHGSRPTA